MDLTQTYLKAGFHTTFRNFEVIELLKNAGASIKHSHIHLANELCTLAITNDLDGMTAWHVAGADLDSENYDQRTALHIAVAENNEDIVRFLISQVRYLFLSMLGLKISI